MDWKRYSLPIITVGIAFLFSCGGGGSDIDPPHFGDPNDNPGVEGDILPPPNPADIPQTGTISGATGSAPLGTDPAYDVVEASDVIETNFIGGTSSVRGTSQEDRIFWVAVVLRGETPIEGQSVPPLFEGDDIDLYMRYQVYDIALTISRTWYLEAAGLDFIEPAVVHPQAGVYEAIFPFTIPFGSAGLEAIFVGALGTARETSVFVPGDDIGDVREVTLVIEETPTLPPINYPTDPDPLNDAQGGGGGCLPAFINVVFSGSTVWCESAKELSNVVLEFEDGDHEKWDDLDMDPTRVFEGEFWGTGTNTGKEIVGVWVKSGCNDCGDGPGYGEQFYPNYQELAMAQFAWEDLLTNGDYDYNDFVGRLRATETRDLDNNLVQVLMTVKAVARSAGYDSDWQFNVGAAFPGNSIIAYVDQYYADGTRHGDQRIYISDGGMSVPIFTPIRDALPNPPGSYATNGVPGTLFIDGDYAVITVLLQNPMPQGTYTPIPYEPELRVMASGGNIYTITMWREPGDWVDSNGRPLAFIVPDTYAWPLEGVQIWNVYSGFNDWVDWINDQNLPEPSPVWYDEILTDGSGAFEIGLFN